MPEGPGDQGLRPLQTRPVVVEMSAPGGGKARGLAFGLVCVPGLCEGTFPKPHFDDPLLSGNLAELEAGERLLLRQACATATNKIILSWPRIELASGRVRVPSFYVLEAARAATGEAAGWDEAARREAARRGPADAGGASSCHSGRAAGGPSRSGSAGAGARIRPARRPALRLRPAGRPPATN